MLVYKQDYVNDAKKWGLTAAGYLVVINSGPLADRDLVPVHNLQVAGVVRGHIVHWLAVEGVLIPTQLDALIGRVDRVHNLQVVGRGGQALEGAHRWALTPVSGIYKVRANTNTLCTWNSTTINSYCTNMKVLVWGFGLWTEAKLRAIALETLGHTYIVSCNEILQIFWI